MGDRIDSFPIFPLPLVLLPTEVAPLHIFEERYKLMINRCVAESSRFGVIWSGDEGLAEVGCTARVTEVVDRMADGRMNILVRGERPFRLIRRIDGLAYPSGDVELLRDERGPADGHGDSARATYAKILEKATDERPESDDLAGMDAYGMAATVDLDPALKQRLLASRSEDERLDIVEGVFEEAVARLDQADKVAEAARSNGKVHL